VDRLTRSRQIVLWVAAAVIGLVLATIFNAGWLATVGLVAAVGIAIGFGVAASERTRQRPDHDSD
jgi:hypothetical protein